MRMHSSLLALVLAASGSVTMTPRGRAADQKPEPAEPTEPAESAPEPVARKAVNPISSRMTIAEAMANTGTETPKQALKALNERGGRRYTYMPHVGAKQRAKGLREIEKERARLAAKVSLETKSESGEA